MTETLKLTGESEPEPEQPAKSSTSSTKKKRGGDEAPGARQRRRNDSELANRLDRVFERLVEWLEGRGDRELADAIKEDAAAMRGGLVSLTRPIAAIRAPLLVLLAIAEPLLAFGRVARILGRRLADRRARARAEAEAGQTLDAIGWAAVSDAELQAVVNNELAPAADRDAAEAELRRRFPGLGG